jgi:hypothetical protein
MRYRLLCQDILDTEVGIAPAYQTRNRDNIHVQSTNRTFHNAYQLLRLPALIPNLQKLDFIPQQDRMKADSQP